MITKLKQTIRKIQQTGHIILEQQKEWINNRINLDRAWLAELAKLKTANQAIRNAADILTIGYY